jgi:hypothetical protein
MTAFSAKTLAGLGLLLTLGCADSIVRELDETNSPAVTNTPEEFDFIATEMRNVNDKLVFVWPNTASRAAVHHNSFLHHGYGVLVIQDAVGAVVDSTTLEWELESETSVGVPGDWTVSLTLASARGRAEFSLTPLP